MLGVNVRCYGKKPPWTPMYNSFTVDSLHVVMTVQVYINFKDWMRTQTDRKSRQGYLNGYVSNLRLQKNKRILSHDHTDR